jgi:hypothetical protein
MFVDNSAGSDRAYGRSQTAPRKALSAVSAVTLEPGGAVELIRGGEQLACPLLRYPAAVRCSHPIVACCRQCRADTHPWFSISGVWREGLSIGSSGNATRGPVAVKSYGSETLPKPLLVGSKSLGAPRAWETHTSQDTRQGGRVRQHIWSVF